MHERKAGQEKKVKSSCPGKSAFICTFYWCKPIFREFIVKLGHSDVGKSSQLNVRCDFGLHIIHGNKLLPQVQYLIM